MTTRPLTLTVGALALSLLAACASSNRYDDRYSSSPVPSSSYGRPGAYVEYGVVRSIDTVSMASRPSGAGIVLGAVIGAVVGNQFGSGSGRAAATVGGAVAGGVAGNAIERRQRRDDEAFRVSVRFDDGSVRDFDVQRIDDLRTGDRVKLEGGQLHYVP